MVLMSVFTSVGYFGFGTVILLVQSLFSSACEAAPDVISGVCIDLSQFDMRSVVCGEVFLRFCNEVCLPRGVPQRHAWVSTTRAPRCGGGASRPDAAVLFVRHRSGRGYPSFPWYAGPFSASWAT